MISYDHTEYLVHATYIVFIVCSFSHQSSATPRVII